MPGGVGYSWFDVELTSDHVPVAAPSRPAGSVEVYVPYYGVEIMGTETLDVEIPPSQHFED
jgi:hypothetical protein